MMTKNGKPVPTFESLFELQRKFQQEVISGEVGDNPKWLSYHISGMVEELGEVLKADKRWKTHRNTTYNFEEKLDELCDVFIEAINLALFSGLNVETLLQALKSKIDQNFINKKEI